MWRSGVLLKSYGVLHAQGALSKLFTREGVAGTDGAILPYVGHLKLISTLKIVANCCQLCQYNQPNLTKPNLTKPIQTQRNNKLY